MRFNARQGESNEGGGERSVTRRLKILSSTNVADYVHWRGVTLGLDASGETIKVMINLASCRDEKVEFEKKIMDRAIVFF